MQQLTFNGVNDLYLTPYGAHTLKDYEELVKVRSAIPAQVKTDRIVISSLALEMRNERCIDDYGCSSF